LLQQQERPLNKNPRTAEAVSSGASLLSHSVAGFTVVIIRTGRVADKVTNVIIATSKKI
jgi:hypothetical protein